SSGSRSSDPSWPRCCSSAAGVTFRFSSFAWDDRAQTCSAANRGEWGQQASCGGANRTPDRRKPPEGGRLSRGGGVGLGDPVGRLRPDRRICQLVLQTNGLALVS